MTRSDPEDKCDDMLMALVDGELEPGQAALLQARIARDPALVARLAMFAETGAAMRAAFPPQPVPDRLTAAILADAQPAPDTSARILPFSLRRTAARPLAGLAIAASLLLAVGLGGFLAGRGVPVTGTPLVTAATALSAVPTGGQVTLADGTAARALGSFDTDLGLCRLVEAGAERGVLCRDNTGWTVALAVPGMAEGAFLPASDLGTGLIDQLLDEIGAGAPLDPAAEAQLLAR